MIWELAETLNLEMNLQLRDGDKENKSRPSAAPGRFYRPIYFPYFLIRHWKKKKHQAFYILMSRLAHGIRPHDLPSKARTDWCVRWAKFHKQANMKPQNGFLLIHMKMDLYKVGHICMRLFFSPSKKTWEFDNGLSEQQRAKLQSKKSLYTSKITVNNNERYRKQHCSH